MLFQSLVTYVALTLLTTVYASPIPVEQLNNRGIEISREVEVIGRGSDWRRDGLDSAVIELKRAGTDGRDWRRAEENVSPPWKRAAEAEAGPPGGAPGW